MRKLKLSSVCEMEVELDNYKFTIRGLNREEALSFLQEAEELRQLPENEQADALLELEDKLLNTCIEDEKAREMVKKAAQLTYRKIIDAILELSGIKEGNLKN